MKQKTSIVADIAKDKDVEAQLAEFRKELADVVESVKNFSSEGIKRKVSDIYHDAKLKGSESYYDAKDKLNDLQDQLAEEVRKKPLSSIAIAASAGLIFGLLIRR